MKKTLLILIGICVAGYFLIQALQGEMGTVGFEAVDSKEKAYPEFSLEVIEPGKEPRRKITMKFQEGLRESGYARMKMSVAMGMGGAKMPQMSMPGMSFPIEMHVDGVDAAGTAGVSFKYGDIVIEPSPGVDPKLVEEIQESMTALKDFSGTVRISNRGEVQDLQMKFSDSLPAQISQMVNQMVNGLMNGFVFFPDQSLGVGAKWSIRYPELQAGLMKTDMTITYEITESSGNELKLAVSQKSTTPGQEIDTAGQFPQGMVAYLKSGGSESSGSITLNLEQLIPEANFMTTFSQEVELSEPNNPNAPTQLITTDGKAESILTKKAG